MVKVTLGWSRLEPNPGMVHVDHPRIRLQILYTLTKGAGQHVEGHSTFTNQTVCQPTDVFGEDILLLVDKTGLALTFDIWPAPFVIFLT